MPLLAGSQVSTYAWHEGEILHLYSSEHHSLLHAHVWSKGRIFENLNVLSSTTSLATALALTSFCFCLTVQIRKMLKSTDNRRDREGSRESPEDILTLPGSWCKDSKEDTRNNVEICYHCSYCDEKWQLLKVYSYSRKNTMEVCLNSSGGTKT